MISCHLCIYLKDKLGVFGVYVTRVWVPRGQETVLDPLGTEATGRIHAEPLTGVLGTKLWS